MSAQDKQEVRLTEPGNRPALIYLIYHMEHHMNAKNIIAAAAIFAATGSAFAQGASEFVEFNNVASTRTRAEVQAELVQAVATPEFVEFTRVASTASRARVITATGSTPEFVEHVNIASSRSRAEVREEMLQAAKAARSSIGG